MRAFYIQLRVEPLYFSQGPQADSWTFAKWCDFSAWVGEGYYPDLLFVFVQSSDALRGNWIFGALVILQQRKLTLKDVVVLARAQLVCERLLEQLLKALWLQHPVRRKDFANLVQQAAAAFNAGSSPPGNVFLEFTFGFLFGMVLVLLSLLLKSVLVHLCLLVNLRYLFWLRVAWLENDQLSQ